LDKLDSLFRFGSFHQQSKSRKRPKRSHDRVLSNLLFRRSKLSALSRGLSVLMMLLMFCPTAAVYAETYDLGSTTSSISATRAGVIKVGGSVRSINVGDMITPAEFAALNQINSSGRQTLNVSTAGSATGGRFNIGADLGSNIGSLVIPQGVNALGDFSKITGASFTLPGNLTNSGALYGYSTNTAVNTATFNAQNIINNIGGLISTIVPQSIFGISSALQSVDLTLNATQDIINSGTITSSGALNLIAGGAIVNALPATADIVVTPKPVMEAASNVNLHSASGSFTNAGTINSIAGNINITSPADLVFNNTNGVLSSLGGDINVRESGYAGAQQLSIFGGDLLSRQVHINGGMDAVDLHVNNLTGTLNTAADFQHVITATPVLTLGNISIIGDPTYANTAGSVALTGNITVGERLAILASQDITSAAAVNLRAVAGGVGQDITLIAGGNLSGTSGSPIGAGTTVTLDGASATGGQIFLATGSTIDASGTAGAGGNIFLGAYSGSSSTSSTINLSGSSLNTSGSGSAANGGSITVAGASNGNAITLGTINTSGGTGAALTGFNGGNGGAVTIRTANPVTSNAGPITFNSTGAITSGNTLAAGALSATGGSITVGAITTSGGAGGSGVPGNNGSAGTDNSGTPGASGGIGTNGSSGGAGGAGGSAGAISLTARTGITAGALTAVGGAGGAGGAGGTGGAGGAAGAGTTGTNATSGNPPTGGSAGGAGGNGGTGGAGGNGGIGGNAGAGAAISLTTSNGPITVSGAVNSSGGIGGAGGNGGIGGAGASGAAG
jgi:hypothetical protein